MPESATRPLSYDIALADISLRVTEWTGRARSGRERSGRERSGRARSGRDRSGRARSGGSDPVLLLHATGFHSRCWDQVARRLPGVHLYAVDLRFHGGSGRLGDVDWDVMADDIEQLLAVLELTRVVGVGHSLGGYLIARVAAQQLARFKQLVLIDPVIFPRDSYAEQFNYLVNRDPAENPVSRRKKLWQDAEEMYQRFRSRPPFDRWQDQVLRDYCDYALREVSGESTYQLACDPLHEAAIYLNQRGNEVIYQLLPELKLPVTLLRARPAADASLDLAASPTWPGLVNELPHAREFYFPGMSHFIPMEEPELVARIIREALEEKWS